MITVLFLDELKLSSELTEAANNAAALPSRDVSKEAFYFGILSSIILPGATVLGFSRSEKKIMKKILLRKSSSVYNLVDDDDTDLEKIEEMTEDIQETTSFFSCSKKRNLCMGILLAVIAIFSFTIAGIIGRVGGGDYTNTATTTTTLSVEIFESTFVPHNDTEGEIENGVLPWVPWGTGVVALVLLLLLLYFCCYKRKNENERAIIDTNYVYGAPYYAKRQTLVVDENVMYPKQLSLDGSDSESK